MAGRWIAPWLWFNGFGNKGYGAIACYTAICWFCAAIISIVCGYMYIYIIIDIICIKVIGVYEWMNPGDLNHMDFIWGFGMGNLTLVYNGLQFFSAKGWAYNPKPED